MLVTCLFFNKVYTNSVLTDSGLIIPQEGVIVNGECVTMTTKPSASVNLKLEV
jgi:hypothetical protein